MTLEELDNALMKLGLDIESECGKKTKDKIFTLHGKCLISTKKQKCERCWFREHNRCSEQCNTFHIKDDPIEASKLYISNSNDINLFSFIILYVIPVYEEETGKRNVMDDIVKEYTRLMKIKTSQNKSVLL